MELNELQNIVDKWIKETGGYWNKCQTLAQLNEELGEVAHALKRKSDLRPRKIESDIEVEVGNLLFTLTVFANANGLNLNNVLIAHS